MLQLRFLNLLNITTMNVSICIRGGTSDNATLAGYIECASLHTLVQYNLFGGDIEMFYARKGDAVKALAEAYRALKRDYRDRDVSISRSRDSLTFDTSTAYIWPPSASPVTL
jgi:hypothetical protein